jgi:hypothetical protein
MKISGLSTRYAILAVLACLSEVPVSGAELKPQTVAGFEHYVHAAEADMNARRGFLWLDRDPEGERETRLADVRKGALSIQHIDTLVGGNRIPVPDGLVHHWLGMVFIPGAALEPTLQLLQDYDRHAVIYAPSVSKSALLARDGDLFRARLRFIMKKGITVVVDTENEARFKRFGTDRAKSRIYSVRVNEIEKPDTPSERVLPVGKDGGYLWRLYTYWRFLERDGGTYVQCESISLTRSIPVGLRWLIGPFVTSIPKDSLTFTLEATRRALQTK